MVEESAEQGACIIKPVPEPMAPMKSAMIVRAPIHMPPKAAAVGMYLLSSFFSD